MFKILKNEFFWIGLILIISFLLRFWKIESPIADWHSWRQADTAAVTRNFIKEGFNPFFPKYDDFSGVSEKPLVNLNRFRFVEFPVYNIATFPFYLYFGVYEKYARLTSVLFSLGSIVFLYLICKKYLGTVVSLLTSAIYGLLPFNVFFSRTTLPEPTFLFFTLGMMYFVEKWIWESAGRRKVKWGILGFSFMSIAFLIKPWAIFFYIPLLYSTFVKRGKIWPLPFNFLIFSILALMPFLIWRLWILSFPEGIPASGWLYNGDHIRFRMSFWYWMISERLGREIFGATGLILFILGLLKRPNTGRWLLHIWALSMFLYFVIFATGNVRHNYYQYIFVPVGAIFLTQGFLFLIQGDKVFLPRVWTIISAFFLLVLAFYLSYMQVKGFYQINNYVIVEAGREADKILPKEAIVVAPYNGDSAFLYQINRPGWPITALPLKELVADYGATHFVSTTRDDKTNWVLRHFEILEDNPRFVIANLTKISSPITPEDQEP